MASLEDTGPSGRHRSSLTADHFRTLLDSVKMSLETSTSSIDLAAAVVNSNKRGAAKKGSKTKTQMKVRTTWKHTPGAEGSLV